MNELHLADVDSLLMDFEQLQHPPVPSLPERKEDLWRQAIDDAWKAEEEHTKKCARFAEWEGNG